MKAPHRLLAAGSLLAAAAFVFLPLLADEKGEGKGEKPPPVQEKTPPAGTLTDGEKKFQESLTEATLTGRWRLVKDGKIGEEKEEKYTIRSASRIAGDLWILQARIQYGDHDVTVPVPVKVLWAGDTPVISLNSVPVPGLGTFTARVLFYGDLYSGTWSGGDHGGFLQGTISRSKKESSTGTK